MLEIEKPRIDCVEEKGGSYAKFVMEPLEKGFGVTIGNSLRRILLSSLPGSAVTNIRIAGVDHEFMALKGAKEDVTEVVLNMKGLAVKIDSDDKYIHFFQNMREPSLETSLEIDKWNGMLLEKDSTIPSEVKYFIRIVTKDKNIDFYQTINKKEVEQISNSLNTIYKNLKGE